MKFDSRIPPSISWSAAGISFTCCRKPSSASGRSASVIGWASQATAQAQNLRDSLEGFGISVVVGLRQGSPSFAKAAAAGFSVENGTAGEMFDVIARSDHVLILIADAAQAELYDPIQQAMRPGACLGFSHGFVLAHMKNVVARFRDDIDVIGVCPKGMGASVRLLYQQGKEENGAGINASYAIEQDVSGNAENLAIGWAIAIGSPTVFQTTLTNEYLSDISGERGTLLAGVWAVSEGMNDYFIGEGSLPQEAFIRSAMSITGPISKKISDGGLRAIADGLSGEEQDRFFRTLQLGYEAAMPIVEQIYNEVLSGREVAGVVDQSNALKKHPWTRVDGTKMWRTGQEVRKNTNIEVPLEPATAGAYLAIMLAQVDVLRANGHPWSEVINETIIEATDSLNPYMAARGIQYLVDNCSTTARLGARKWGPQFRQMVVGDILPKINTSPADQSFRDWFYNHPVHEAHRVCSQFKPSVSISVQ